MDNRPYSPNVFQCDYFLFSKLKISLKGIRFENIEAIETTAANSRKCSFKNKPLEVRLDLKKNRSKHCINSIRMYFK